MGFTASRKVGKAVERNRARRRLRAAAAEVLPEKGQPGYDYVVIARQACLRRSYGALLADLSTAVERVAARSGDKRARPGRARPAGGRAEPEPR